MKLYMIRHGESMANAERRHAGWAHVPLTEKGREDARRAGALIREMNFDKIYVSDTLRARETLALALPEVTGLQTSLLREIGVGSLSGRLASVCAAEYGERYAEHRRLRDFSAYGGENHEMQFERIKAFSELILRDGGETVLAVCHEGSIKCMLEIVRGKRLAPGECSLANGSLSVFEYRDGRWFCTEWNKVSDEV